MTDALHLTPREVAQVEAALGEPDDGTDGVRCQCGRFVPCRHCPTPIDPADIRSGDVVERRLCERMTVLGALSESGPGESATIATSRGIVFADFGGYTWRLVHRPDPDAEARVCAWAEYRKDYAPNPHHEAAAHKAFVAGWQAAREQGWDVVRRAEP